MNEATRFLTVNFLFSVFTFIPSSFLTFFFCSCLFFLSFLLSPFLTFFFYKQALSLESIPPNNKLNYKDQSVFKGVSF